MQPPPDTALAAPPAAPGIGAPPHDLEAEMSVLGAILISDRTLYALVIEEGLKPEDFYRERHRLGYGAVLALFRAGGPVGAFCVRCAPPGGRGSRSTSSPSPRSSSSAAGSTPSGARAPSTPSPARSR